MSAHEVIQWTGALLVFVTIVPFVWLSMTWGRCMLANHVDHRALRPWRNKMCVAMGLFQIGVGLNLTGLGEPGTTGIANYALGVGWIVWPRINDRFHDRMDALDASP